MQRHRRQWAPFGRALSHVADRATARATAPLRPMVLAVVSLTAVVLLAGCTDDQATTTSAGPGVTGSTTITSETATTAGGSSTTEGAPVVTAESSVVFQAPYGDADGEFGFIPANESISEGPRAFWVTPSGDLYILDPVKHRVVMVAASDAGAASPKVIATPGALAPRDLAVTTDGTVVVDDSDGSATYQVYSAAGELLDSVESAFGQVISVGLAGDGALIYAHLATGEGGLDMAYVPLFEGGALLDPKDHLAAAGPRTPVGDGWTAEIGTGTTEEAGGVPAGTLRLFEGDQLIFESEPEPRPLGGFVLRRTTAGRFVFSGIVEIEPTGDSTSGSDTTVGDGGGVAAVRMVWLFDEQGGLVSRTQLPLEENLVDTFVIPVRATAGGALYTLNTDDKGLTIRRLQVE